MRISSPRLLGLALTAAALAAPAVARADERVEVTITPEGRPWSVGRLGGQECAPTCTVFVDRGTYEVHVGDIHETFPLETATAITYAPGAPKVRTIAGWAAVGGVGVGGALMALGIYGFLTTPCTSTHCYDIQPVSKPTAEGLIFGAAGLITISVAGGIVFAVTSPSLTARDLAPPDERRRTRSFDLVLGPSARGGVLGLRGAF